MPNIRIDIGGEEYQSQISSEQLNVILRILKGETISTKTPPSNTPTTQPADSSTSLTMSDIKGSMKNFSTSHIRDLQRLVTTWADSIYPTRTLEDTLIKLLEEVAELFKDPSEEELADVMILAMDLFHLASVPIGKAVEKKMRINIEERTWKIDPKTGIMKHVTP